MLSGLSKSQMNEKVKIIVERHNLIFRFSWTFANHLISDKNEDLMKAVHLAKKTKHENQSKLYPPL